MKILIIAILCSLSLTSYAQFEKPLSLTAGSNFNFKTKGLGMNDAGFGINLDASLFAKHKLQLLVETGSAIFIGNKLRIVYADGTENKNPVIYSIKAGPRFFISKNIALSATFGPEWHSASAVSFTADNSFKFAATGFFGVKRRLVAEIFMVDTPKDSVNIRYFGIGLGYRFH
jgi:hypothetical protein